MRSHHAFRFTAPIDTIQNEDIRAFAWSMVDCLPTYFYNVGASSTGKYHPPFAHGWLGLFRHSVAALVVLNTLVSERSDLTEREKDLMRVAILFHDAFKSGTQEQWEKSKFTRKDHPKQAANCVLSLTGLPENEKVFVADCIRCHMGAFYAPYCPVPVTEAQKLVNAADSIVADPTFDMPFPEEMYGYEDIPI